MLQLLVIVNAVPTSLILFTLMMEPILSSERRFLQGPHGVTSQKKAFFNNFYIQRRDSLQFHNNKYDK
jgi:hypothetical protein